MNTLQKIRGTSIILAVICLGACSTWNRLDNSTRGGVIGGTSGAVVGSVVGNTTGALVGSAAGAVGGAVIGNEMDKDERRQRARQ